MYSVKKSLKKRKKNFGDVKRLGKMISLNLNSA